MAKKKTTRKKKSTHPVGIKTYYKGVLLRSRFEGTTAYFLDKIKAGWMYEPDSFLLESGYHYIPDFWVPKLHLWVEVRGYTSVKGQAQLKGFGELVAARRVDGDGWILNNAVPAQYAGKPRYGKTSDYLVIGEKRATFWDSNYKCQGQYNGDIWVCQCKCGKFYIAAWKGYRGCRHCGANSPNATHVKKKWRITIERGNIFLNGTPIQTVRMNNQKK